MTSLPLLRKIVEDLEQARNSGECSLSLYFTKESHIHTLLNLVLFSGLPIANPTIPELDYAVRKCGYSGGVVPFLIVTLRFLTGDPTLSVTPTVRSPRANCTPWHLTFLSGLSYMNAKTGVLEPTNQTRNLRSASVSQKELILLMYSIQPSTHGMP